MWLLSATNVSSLLACFVFLLSLLSLCQDSTGFGLGFGGSDSDETVPSTKQVPAIAKKGRPSERKFKFHKLERIYFESDEEVKNSEEIAADEEDDDNRREQAKVERVAMASNRANEDEEFQFERARKAQKDQRGKRENDKEGKKGKKNKNDKDEKVKESSSIYGSILGTFFGGSSEKEEEKEAAQKNEKSEPTSGSGLIDWLQWLGHKFTGSEPAVPPAPPPEPSESWLLSYFNRWPFNSFFPIGKPAKPIKMPRRTPGDYSNGEASTAAAEPMSQEHFESLLHTLPGFVINASHVRDTECRQQMQIFHRQLRGHKLWTLQMLDATGKVGSSLLRGNINQLGDFDLCMQVKTLVKVTPDVPMRIRGKYCLAHIETQTTVPELKLALHLAHGRGLWNSHLGNPSHFVPRYSVATLGVCIPHICSAKAVQDMLQTNLRPYNNTGVEFHVEVDDNDCTVHQNLKLSKLFKKHNGFSVTCCYLLVLVLLMISSLIAEYWLVIKEFVNEKIKARMSQTAEVPTDNVDGKDKDEEVEGAAKESDVNTTTKADEPVEETNEQNTQVQGPTNSVITLLLETFKAFSPKRTLSILLSKDHPDMELSIFHVLKLFATFMLYICLKFLMIGHLPISNRDTLVRTFDQPLSIVFRAPFIYTDVLLLISGFLSSNQLSEEMEQRSYIQLLKRLTAKATRYIPTIYVVLLITTWILPLIGEAPLWNNLIGENARLCEQHMWRNIFSVQNAIDFEETCSPMTIAFALEVQLYLLGPLIVWLYHIDADASFYTYGAIHALSVAARYSRTNREHLSMTLFHGMNVSKFYRTANLLYSSPIGRATPYLIGIGAGLLYRVHNGVLDIPPDMLPYGWLLSVVGILWCFWVPSSGMNTDYIYKSADAASYAAWSPLILGLCLTWLIFMFPRDDKSVLGYLASTRPIVFLSRITFPIQLMMYVVVLYNTAGVKEGLKYGMSEMLNFNELGAILFFAIILAFLIDVPSQQIRRLLVNRIFIERTPAEHDVEPVSDVEHLEGEDDAQESEDVKIKTEDDSESERAADSPVTTGIQSNGDLDTNDANGVDEVEEEEEEEEEIEVEIEVEEEVEEEVDITEEDEVKKRPEQTTDESKTEKAQLPAEEKEEESASTYRRRRRF